MGERDAGGTPAYPIEPLETAWAIRASGMYGTCTVYLDGG